MITRYVRSSFDNGYCGCQGEQYIKLTFEDDTKAKQNQMTIFLKSETIKEFAKRAKEVICSYVNAEGDIDQIVEEMIGEM